MQEELSRFERVFEDFPVGHALASRRSQSFDSEHGLFFSPLSYEPIPLLNKNLGLPSLEWTRESFDQLVRAEFGEAFGGYLRALPNIETPERCDFLELSIRMRDSFEQNHVFSELISEVLKGTSVFSSKERLFRIFCSDYFGRKENSKNISFDAFSDMLHNIHVGLRCLVLGLPFRDQNRFRTQDNPGDVTAAESLFLVRMHCIALAAYQVLPTGADILVLSDGRFFGDLFNIGSEELDDYLARVRRLRNRLNLNGTVQIIDLKSVIDKFESESGAFATCTAHIADHLHTIRSQPTDAFAKNMESMEIGFRRNFSTRNLNATDEQVERWLNCEEVDGTDLPSGGLLSNLAVEYAARNLALKWFDVVTKFFPTAVRGTMHPKPGQLGFPRMGDAFPWNGVAVLDAQAIDESEMTIYPLDKAARRYRQLVPVVAESGNVVYYKGVERI